MWQKGASLRARIETYRTVLQLQVDELQRLQEAALQAGHTELQFLRAVANGHELLAASGSAVAAAVAADSDAEVAEKKQLRGQLLRVCADEIAGPHSEAVARFKRFVDRRAAARAEATPAPAAAAAAVEIGRPPSFLEYPYEFRKKVWQIIRRARGASGYES